MEQAERQLSKCVSTPYVKHSIVFGLKVGGIKAWVSWHYGMDARTVGGGMEM